MKTLNKSMVFLALTAMLGFFSTCKKYEDGPLLSLRSRTSRVANTWKIDNYTINNTDVTSLFGGYTETYSKDGNYSYTWGILNGTGTWKFANNDAEIILTGKSNQADRILIILKLEDEQLWFYYFADSSDRHELHMIEN